MRALMVRFGLWLLDISGEKAEAERVTVQLAARIAVRHSINDMREAERWSAEARLRLERLDALGANIAREQDTPGE